VSGASNQTVTVALAALALAWGAFIFAWEPAVLTLTVDDSFYYLATARNFARGLGFTFDGIHATNGFQPLWMWLLVPIARAFGDDLDTLARVVLVGQVALVLAATGALLRLGSAPTSTRSGLAALTPFGGFYFMKVFANGMESAVHYALLVALLWLLAVTDARETSAPRRARALFALAAVGAALTLARLTSVVFAVPALAWAARRWGARWKVALASGAVYIVPLAAYAVANCALYGHILPVSVAIKLERPPGDWSTRLLALGTSVGPVAAMLGVLGRRRGGDTACAAELLAGGATALALLDALRGAVVPEIWTLVPQATLLLLVLSRDPAPRVLATPARRYAIATLVLAFGAAEWSARCRAASYAPYVEARRAGLWLKDHTPPVAVAAGWDCGIAGAYSSRRMINLDGLVNSWAYKTDVLDRGGLSDYLDEAGVDYVVQPFDVDLLPTLEREAWASWSVAYAHCFDFRPVLSRPSDAPRHIVELVLARRGAGPSLSGFSSATGGLCGAGSFGRD
jgi:hypothetical protein